MWRVKQVPVKVIRCFNYDFFGKIDIKNSYKNNILSIPKKILNDTPFIVPEDNKIQYLDYINEDLNFVFCKINENNSLKYQYRAMIQSGEFSKGIYFPIINSSLKIVNLHNSENFII